MFCDVLDGMFSVVVYIVLSVVLDGVFSVVVYIVFSVV